MAEWTDEGNTPLTETEMDGVVQDSGASVAG